MANVKVDFETRKFIRLFDEFTDELMDALADRTRKSIREEVPVDTGNLRDSTIIVKKELKTRFRADVGTDVSKRNGAPYAPYVFYGLPDGIKPKNKKFLRFILKDGTVVFTKFVRPRKPQDWITPALQKTKSRAPQIITNVLLSSNLSREFV